AGSRRSESLRPWLRRWADDGRASDLLEYAGNAARLVAAPARADADHAARGRARRPDRVLRRRLHRRVAADPHLRSPAVRGLGAALERRGQGPQPVRLEQLLRLPLGLLASPGRPLLPLLPLPEGLAAGRLLRERPDAEPTGHRADGPGSLAGVGLASRRLAAGPLLRPT